MQALVLGLGSPLNPRQRRLRRRHLSCFSWCPAVVQGTKEQLSACPGLGPTKVARLFETFNEPFRRVLTSSVAAVGASGGGDAPAPALPGSTSASAAATAAAAAASGRGAAAGQSVSHQSAPSAPQRPQQQQQQPPAMSCSLGAQDHAGQATAANAATPSGERELHHQGAGGISTGAAASKTEAAAASAAALDSSSSPVMLPNTLTQEVPNDDDVFDEDGDDIEDDPDFDDI